MLILEHQNFFSHDSKDEIDSDILRFERYVKAQSCIESEWALNLSALLKGKALDIYAFMPKEDALDQDLRLLYFDDSN
jgi:hypothetical protein